MLIGLICVCVAIVFLIVANGKMRKAREIDEARRYGEQIDLCLADFRELQNGFIANSDKIAFLERWGALASELSKVRVGSRHSLFASFLEFERIFKRIDEAVCASNKEYVKAECERNDALLSNIDGKSLDAQQREVVVSDEDRTLVLAGAGSGKTLTIAAKVKYLCDVKKIAPSEILVLSFTTKSAGEMTERIQGKLGIPLEASTFHKLGLGIVKQELKFSPNVIDDLNGFVHQFFENELTRNNEFVKKIAEFFAYYIDVPEAIENCSSLGEFYELEKSADLETLKSKYEKEQYVQDKNTENLKSLKTLRGEIVKSIEETKIANFLFLNGINYEYERLYPFESGSSAKKAYRPDFYLTDYDIYLEHFGISKDNRLPWLSPAEEKKYLDSIEWKRRFHAINGTRLIETYSYYTSEGILLEKLEEILSKNGVVFAPRDFSDIFETIYAKKSEKYFAEFINLCCAFILLYKSNNYAEERFGEFKKRARIEENQFVSNRVELFMDLAKIIFEAYQDYLRKNNAIDFSDMINSAAEKVKRGADIPRYKYVIVDEYQDISLARFNLIKAIVGSTGAKLLCVGDDWQSIYRFAGSDITLFTEFEKSFGYTNLLKIEKTYRNSQELIDEAAAFVLKNSMQLKKDLKSDKHLNHSLVFWGYDDEPYKTLGLIVKKIISEFGEEKSILFLGRTNYDIEILNNSGLFDISMQGRTEKITYLASPKTPVSFLSVHKSKGLEADNVVLLNFKNSRLGFPNQISDDKVLEYVLVKGEDYLFAEERRLFYVAITRTKNRTFILMDNKSPSIFFNEFSESEKVCFVSTGKVSENSKCPRCKKGVLVQRNHNERTFFGCSNYPKCDYALGNVAVLSKLRRCPACGDFLVERENLHNRKFWGCRNFPYCDYTEN